MRVTRLDRIPIPRIDSTKEGYLRGEAVVTRTGVFKYTGPDGSIHGELRHPDDVMAADSLGSLKAIPITVGHPPVFVSAQNAGDLSVGLTGEAPRADGQNVIVGVTVTHQRAIDAVAAGSKELSLGYNLDLEEESGVWEGEPYQYRQRNISYNHLAIVDVARAGRIARLNTDGNAVEEEDKGPMIKVNLDGIQYDAAPEVAKALEKATARADTAEAALKDANKRADTAEAQRDDNKSKLDVAETKLKDTTGIDALVASRVALLATAAKFDSSDFTGKSPRDIQISVIKTARKDFDATGKSDDYVQASFDAVVGTGAPNPQVTTSTPPIAPVGAPRNDAEAEQAAYRKSVSNFNDWRKQA